MNRLILTIIGLSLTVSLLSQEANTKDHPIDLKCKQCLEADSSATTTGMIKCQIVAAQEWDQELNKYYKLLLGVLKPDEIEKLKSSQIQWLKYRDTEFAFSQVLYYNMQGTMWRVVYAGRRTEVIKQRVLELKNYYEDLNPDK